MMCVWGLIRKLFYYFIEDQFCPHTKIILVNFGGHTKLPYCYVWVGAQSENSKTISYEVGLGFHTKIPYYFVWGGFRSLSNFFVWSGFVISSESSIPFLNRDFWAFYKKFLLPFHMRSILGLILKSPYLLVWGGFGDSSRIPYFFVCCMFWAAYENSLTISYEWDFAIHPKIPL